MTEKRQLRRWQLIYYLRAFEETNGRVLGHVVDITTEGLMLISESRIEPGNQYGLRIECPSEEDRSRAICFSAESLWTRRDVNVAFFDTGFRLHDPSTEAVLAIQELIEELHFPGPVDVNKKSFYLSSELRG